MVLKKLLFVFQCRSDRFGLVDIPLTTIDNGHVTQSEGDDPSGQNVHYIGTLVHQVDLGQDTNSTCTLWVNFASHFQTVRVGQIGISSSDGENDSVGLGNEPHQHVPDLLFDISRLVTNGYFGQTGQVDQSEGEDIGGEYPQVDRVG